MGSNDLVPHAWRRPLDADSPLCDTVPIDHNAHVPDDAARLSCEAWAQAVDDLIADIQAYHETLDNP